MARIAGINIPPHQHAEIGLTAIYGIGRPRARTILDSCGIEYSKKIKDLSDAELERIRDAVSKITVEGDLRREIQLSIKRLIAPPDGTHHRPPRALHRRLRPRKRSSVSSSRRGRWHRDKCSPGRPARRKYCGGHRGCG